MLKYNLVIDIETVVNQAAADEYFKTKNFVAPSTYKNPEAILRNIEEQKRKAIAKAALKPFLSKVVAIGYQLIDSLSWKPEPVKCFYGDDEGIVLTNFAEKLLELETEEQKDLYLWGYNSLHFDFPFLYDRYRALNLGVPAILNQKFRLKDVKTLCRTSSNAPLAVPLDEQLYCAGIPLKEGSGQDLSGWYKEGQWDKITSYCMADVEKTTELLRRSRPYKGIDIYQG